MKLFYEQINDDTAKARLLSVQVTSTPGISLYPGLGVYAGHGFRTNIVKIVNFLLFFSA